MFKCLTLGSCHFQNFDASENLFKRLLLIRLCLIKIDDF